MFQFRNLQVQTAAAECTDSLQSSGKIFVWKVLCNFKNWVWLSWGNMVYQKQALLGP